MTWLFAAFYLIPAAAAALGFWAIWRFTRLLDLELATRRVLFAALGALLFAPMMVPAGFIYVAWVPHVLLLAEPDLGYYLKLARYVLPSFAATAVVFWLIAIWRLRAAPTRLGWGAMVLPVVTLALLVGLYRYSFPGDELPAGVDPKTLEAAYGKQLDAVAAVLGIDDDAQRQAEIDRLRAVFRADPSVLRIATHDHTKPNVFYSAGFYYQTGDPAPSVSCSSSGEYRLVLMRCTWSYGTFNRRDVLRYIRLFDRGDAQFDLILELDYRKALRAIRR